MYKAGLEYLVEETLYYKRNNMKAGYITNIACLMAYNIFDQDLEQYHAAPKYSTREEYLEWLKRKNLKLQA